MSDFLGIFTVGLVAALVPVMGLAFVVRLISGIR